MKIKVGKTVGNVTIDIEGEIASEIIEAMSKLSEITGVAVQQTQSKGATGTQGSSLYLLEWLRAEPTPHAQSWIRKHCGFSNALKLLQELESSGQLVWHECLYPAKSGGFKTMSAAFVDGLIPEHKTPAQDIETCLEWIKLHPGRTTRQVETNCGVVKKHAVIALNKLLVRADVEMRTDGKGGHTVWAVES